MTDERSLECPCCGDDGAYSDDQGCFGDGQPLVCGCPGQVSLDGETKAYISIDECVVDCVACRLRSQVADLERQLAEARAALDTLAGRVNAALVHLENVGPPENTCCGDPVCHENSEWPPYKWCDSCLANAARRALATTEEPSDG